MPPEFAISMAALHAALHSIRMLANAGLVSPSDVETSLDGITETLENLPDQFVGIFQAKFDPVFAEIRSAAAAKWKP